MRPRSYEEELYEQPSSQSPGLVGLARQLVPLAVIGVLLLALFIALPLLVILLSAIIEHFQEITDTTTRVIQVALITLMVLIPLVGCWVLVRLGINVWYRWRAHPLHARADRFPAVVRPDGSIEALDKQHPLSALKQVRTLHWHTDDQAREMPDQDDNSVPATSEEWPQAKSLAEIASALRDADRLLLGFELDAATGKSQPVWVNYEDVLTFALAGNSGRGKSNTLLWICLQLLMQQRQLWLIDGKADLRKNLGDFLPCAFTPAEIEQTVDAVTTEVERRLTLSSQDAHLTFPLAYVIIDELDRAIDRYEPTRVLVKLLIEKARSVNIQGGFSNQNIPAALVSGIATRGVITSRFLMYCDDEAGRLLGARKDNGGQALLQRIGPPAPRGLGICRTAAFGWKTIAFPEVGFYDLRWLMQGFDPIPSLRPTPFQEAQSQPLDPVPPLPPNPYYRPPAPDRAGSLSLSLSPAAPRPTVVPLAVRSEERERILQKHREYPTAKPYELCGLAGISNNRWRVVEAVLDEAAEAEMQKNGTTGV